MNKVRHSGTAELPISLNQTPFVIDIPVHRSFLLTISGDLTVAVLLLVRLETYLDILGGSDVELNLTLSLLPLPF